MAVHKGQGDVAGTFSTKQEAEGARAVKAALDKTYAWSIAETDDGKWVLLRAAIEPTAPPGS